ncbi:MAG TPA: beta-propeller fold lactonase family protein [Streptosporangiaceae bacterium]
MRQTSARPGAAVMFGAAPGRGWLRRGRRIGRAAVLAVMACGLAAGCTAAGAPAPAASPAGAPFVYVTGKGGTNEISQFATLGSGALRPLTPPNVASGEFPYDIAVGPQGTSAYAVDNLSNTAGAVSQYTLNPATGKLTPKSPRTAATAGVPSGIIAISPDGKNAYVPAGKAISQYRISPATGKLTPMPPRKVAGAGFPIGIKVAPDGRYLYITSGTNCKAPKGSKGSKGSGCTALAKASTVSVFRISPATGALSAKPVQTVATGQNPQMITIAPDGKSAYVTGGNTIWQYSISPATGRLTPMSPATVATGKSPHDLAVAPDGKNLYVITVGDDTIAQYAITPRSGALSARPVSTARTVSAPEAIALSPDGKNAYVTSEHEGALSQFAISPVTGKITPMSPATVTAPSHGSLGVAVTP